MKRTLFLLTLLLPLVASANTLYKCTDYSGAILYTNQKAAGKSCIVLSHQPSAALPGITAMGSTYSAAKPRTGASATPTPGDFPRVSGDEQKTRDGDRRAILDKELMNEEQNLDAARRKLAELSGQPAEKLQGSRDVVALHERNVIALKKELANLR